MYFAYVVQHGMLFRLLVHVCTVFIGYIHRHVQRCTKYTYSRDISHFCLITVSILASILWAASQLRPWFALGDDEQAILKAYIEGRDDLFFLLAMMSIATSHAVST